ncbi:GAF and ANTAR domain-containing protein [Amycolatopsis sp. NPDC059021]|uniref:GAF and ANTAR domain-containing protein n=1 Tax=Amycolatopsis sp. NPDC059021 TaxID=3346704 RepID=UPI00366E9C72
MRDDSLTEVLVELADTLVDDFDVLDFLHLLSQRCVELLEIDAAGVLLADPRGGLQVVASADEESRILELFQLQTDEGPCADAYRLGAVVGHTDLPEAEARWPSFALKASAAGFQAAYALPMRLRSDIVGVLNLLIGVPGALDGPSMRTAQAMVDVATIGLLQARSARHYDVLIEQLQTALSSRVVIEQAKGFIAERLGLDMAGAFTVLRGYSRRNNRKLTEVATAVVSRSEDVQDLFSA